MSTELALKMINENILSPNEFCEICEESDDWILIDLFDNGTIEWECSNCKAVKKGKIKIKWQKAKE